ncbi:hypothetical protein SO802_028630 [Lithocarpus litseifolius]|uniref:Uncharacterized protein n=1 Tax=Lithocarpus litseifolius TaxID=425828 RepID=A0AAW2BSU1_9ROSI
MQQLISSRKSVSYCTCRYGRYLPFRYLGRYRNKVVSYRKIYWPIPGHFSHTEGNIRFQPDVQSSGRFIKLINVLGYSSNGLIPSTFRSQKRWESRRGKQYKRSLKFTTP